MLLYMSEKDFEKVKQNTIKKYGKEKTKELIKKLNIKIIKERVKNGC